jgi:mannose-6-phosphate isomerase-like protein (cupin superfamily)
MNGPAAESLPAVQRVSAGRGRRLRLPGRESEELFGGADGGASTVRRVRIEPTTARARGFHAHRGCEEIIYVLQGAGDVRTPSSQTRVTAGNVVRIPPDLPHMTVPLAGEALELVAFFPHPDISSITVELEPGP